LDQNPSKLDTNLVPPEQFRFGDFIVDITRGTLMRDKEEVPLRKQAYEMLLILVTHQGELVSKDHLMEAIWGETVVTENSITQCLKEIRHALGDVDLTMIRTVPRRGYIFEPPVERIATGTKSLTATGAGHRKWQVGAMALVILTALSWWVFENTRPAQITPITDATPTPPNSLAVLPFINMSSDPEISFLADGVSEEILNQLAQIPNLLVIARTSSFTFRDQDVDIATIGHQLNVANVLEGSVRVDGETARVTAQLVRTDSQAHLWSRSYDRPLDNIFQLQKSIARDVAQQLHVALKEAEESDAQSAHTPKPEAHEAYLRGQYLMAQRTSESMAGAVTEFGNAVKLDPDYAVAYAGLSLATRFQSETQYGDLPRAEALSRARPYAERALELDPELAEAHAAMGYVLVTWDTFEQALFHFRRAVALNPNYADAAMWLSGFLADMGQYEEAFELLRRAIRADPLSKTALWNYAQFLLDLGRLEDAQKELEKMSSLWPSGYRELRVRLRSHKGQWAEGALAALEAKLENPDEWPVDRLLVTHLAAMGLGEGITANTPGVHPLFFELLGRPQDIVRKYESLKADSGLRTSQEWALGDALAATGDFERALPFLERNWEAMDGLVNIPWFGAKPVLALISARRAMRIESGSEVLVTALQESARRYRDAGLVFCELPDCIDFEIGIAAYLSGDRQTAVGLLTSAVSSGYLIPPNLAYLQILYDDPDLDPVFERQRAHVVKEREKFLRAICPDNPYAKVWQPAEGTCERWLPDEFAVAEEQMKPGR